MSLWDVLMILCGFAPLGGALDTVRGMQKGIIAYGIAVVIGAAIGGLCVWGLQALGRGVELRIESGAGNGRRWYWAALYGCGILTSVCGAVLAGVVTWACIQFV